MEVKQTTVIVLFLSQVMVCSIFLVICTLLIGGLLYWSEGWTYFECVYYCFVGELRHFDALPVGQLYLISSTSQFYSTHVELLRHYAGCLGLCL